MAKYVETQLEQLLTAREAAAFFKVTKRVLFTLDIPYIKIKRARCYDPADIRAWIAKHRVDVGRLEFPSALPRRSRRSVGMRREEEKRKQQATESYEYEVATMLHPNDPEKQALYIKRSQASQRAHATRRARLSEQRNGSQR